MAADNSFDVVSKVEIQEVRNAVDQALKEVRARFDLKDSNSEIKLEDQDKVIQLASSDEYKLEAVKEILSHKLVKRGVSLKSLKYEKLEPAMGKSVRQKITLQQGIPAKRLRRSSSSSKTPRRRSRPPSRGKPCASAARTGTRCRTPSPCCAATTSASTCSSRITGQISGIAATLGHLAPDQIHYLRESPQAREHTGGSHSERSLRPGA